METERLAPGRAARYLGVHPQTLRRWEARGKIRAEHINERGDRRFEISELNRFLKHARTSGEQPDASVQE